MNPTTPDPARAASVRLIHCLTYHCYLRPASCLARQKARTAGPRGAARFPECASGHCAQGRRIAEENRP